MCREMKRSGALSNSYLKRGTAKSPCRNMNREYAAWITHLAHHRISLLHKILAVFLLKLLYAVAYASPFAPFGGFGGSAAVPGGIPRFLGSTVSFRSSRKVLAAGSQSFALRLQAARRRFSILSPVADALGLTRRCQRSTCVTAALPVPMRGMGSQIQLRKDVAS